MFGIYDNLSIESPESETNPITEKPREISEKSEDNTEVEGLLSYNEAMNWTKRLKLFAECQRDDVASNLPAGLQLHFQGVILKKNTPATFLKKYFK